MTRLTRSSSSKARLSLDFSMRISASLSDVAPVFKLILANSIAPNELSCLSKGHERSREVERMHLRDW